MSIKIQVEDAIFLADNNRYLGALTNLMLAIAASSRKTFPKGNTGSLKDPSKKMGDSEAFTLFIGGRIRKLLFGDFSGPQTGNSGISVNFKGKQYDLAFILYKFYRCELVHEGELPEGIEFSAPDPSGQLTVSNSGLSVSISCGDKMILDYGWIQLLVEAVVNARCNGDIFDLKHYDLIPTDSLSDSQIMGELTSKHGTSEGRISILKEAVKKISPLVILASDDEIIKSKFLELVDSGVINGGAITGLNSHQLTDRMGVLSDHGVSIVRELSDRFHLVEVTS